MSEIEDPAAGAALSATLPYVWPEARELSGVRRMDQSNAVFEDADLISALLVGASDGTERWLKGLLETERKRQVVILLVLYPASPTRERHLRTILDLTAAFSQKGGSLELRLLVMQRGVDGDSEQTRLPPTAIQAHNTTSGRTVMSIGSVGDAGFDVAVHGSLNFVFQPDDAQRDAWRRWFQYMFTAGAALNEQTACIPHLIPAKGDAHAATLWEQFEATCHRGEETVVPPRVDPDTGEVVADAAGNAVDPWDSGKTALDPLARVFQQVYGGGWLVTVDETTRIPPLSVPVKATLLGQQSERTVGAVQYRQAFKLHVLSDDVSRVVEKCRKVTDLMDLLTLPLSKGNRWLPEAARTLFNKELDARSQRGRDALGKAIGDGGVGKFIEKRTESIRKDLNEMYRQLGQGDVVPRDKVDAVLGDIEKRLDVAITRRITPRATYNRLLAPDLTSASPDENWNQPLSLLVRSAELLRESVSDRYFSRRFVGLSFSAQEFRTAVNVFGDVLLEDQSVRKAEDELGIIARIVEGHDTAKAKCQAMWRLITGTASDAGASATAVAISRVP